MTDEHAARGFATLPDLAAERFGGAVVLTNDEFFAEKENLLKAAAPVWKEGLYTDRGKWMDGWETRRRRDVGSDWCVIRLGLAGIVRGIVVDTAFFTGNFPDSCSLEGTALEGVPDATALAAARWVEILPRSPLRGDTKTSYAIANIARWTHLRFHIYPDGGVARLRVHGDVAPDWGLLTRSGGWVDLAAQVNGGRIVSQSDAFYGDANRMLGPGRATHMGDGWETKRRRMAGNEWAVVHLARRGVVKRIEVDTDHFKGNAPGWCSVESCVSTDGALEKAAWATLLVKVPLQPHSRHAFEKELAGSPEATHARLSIYPDGGIARLRLPGTLCSD